MGICKLKKIGDTRKARKGNHVGRTVFRIQQHYHYPQSLFETRPPPDNITSSFCNKQVLLIFNYEVGFETRCYSSEVGLI